MKKTGYALTFPVLDGALQQRSGISNEFVKH